MIIREGIQCTHIYQNPEIEKIRYNPYRRKNRQKAEEAYANNVHLPFPLHVIVETSSLCQLSCQFCNREVMTRPQTNMALDTFKKVADECAENGVYSLSLYALGEPLLNTKLPEMIQYAKNKGIPYVDVSTNGMLKMDQLLGTGLNEVIISVDGDRDTHNVLRKGADHEIIRENVNKLFWMRDALTPDDKLAVSPLIRLQIIDIPETHALIPAYIERWKDTADVICVKRLEVMSQNLGDKNLPQAEIDKRIAGRKPCKQLWFVLTVTSVGDIAACCHDSYGKSTLGNLNHNPDVVSIKQCWDKLPEIRKRHLAGDYSDLQGLCGNCIDTAW